jgi:8-oxo-dGTP pyrophosphatase MutT (NUDIX family)
MRMSSYYRSIRDCVGSALLLIPAVAAIVRDEAGRVLLQQRHDDSWSLPAGAMEPGESPTVAVIREVFEETGLQVRPSRIAAVVGGSSCRVRYPNGDEVEYVVTVFDCESRRGTFHRLERRNSNIGVLSTRGNAAARIRVSERSVRRKPTGAALRRVTTADWRLPRLRIATDGSGPLRPWIRSRSLSRPPSTIAKTVARDRNGPVAQPSVMRWRWR